MKVEKNKYYHIQANELCSFGIKVVEIKSNGKFLGITHFNHLYEFEKDEYDTKQITKQEWANNY